jgi:hypothetical protein
MSYVNAYRKCDICGQKLNREIEEFNYRIEPRSRVKMKLWRYILEDPYDNFWTCGVDICSDCWTKMIMWITEQKLANDLGDNNESIK